MTTVTRWGERDATLYTEAYAQQYRAQDEAADRNRSIARFGGWLRHVCERFDRLIDVLDLGCGTGRYFHALTRVRRLVGIDVSRPMLDRAHHPLGGVAVDLGRVTLVEADLLSYEFQREEFDLVYSVGVLAEHSPFDETVASRVHRWLKGGGRFAFTTVHPKSASLPRTLARRVGECLEPVVFGAARRTLRARLMSHGLYADEERVREVLRRTHFEVESIERVQSDVHLHVSTVALKT